MKAGMPGLTHIRPTGGGWWLLSAQRSSRRSWRIGVAVAPGTAAVQRRRRDEDHICRIGGGKRIDGERTLGAADRPYGSGQVPALTGGPRRSGATQLHGPV